jgi:predicted alpha/beta-hydrolase family hydrolase
VTSADAGSSEWPVTVGEARVRAVFEPAIADALGATFVFAHGAGGHMADRGMLALAMLFRRACGMDVVRFNFPYREQRSARPDPMPRLTECIARVVERVREIRAPSRLILGGRSMGGRAASMLVADGQACDGLLLLAYPLHPAGRPEKLRVAHLPRIRVPVLCLNGTRDPLCTSRLMEDAVRDLPHWTMHWLVGADHSFHVTRASGRTDGDVLDEISRTANAWLAAIEQRA